MFHGRANILFIIFVKSLFRGFSEVPHGEGHKG